MERSVIFANTHMTYVARFSRMIQVLWCEVKLFSTSHMCSYENPAIAASNRYTLGPLVGEPQQLVYVIVLTNLCPGGRSRNMPLTYLELLYVMFYRTAVIVGKSKVNDQKQK